MSTSTPNLGLVKPAGIDNIDVASINTNWDKLDTAYGAAFGGRTQMLGADFVNTTTVMANVFSFSVKANKQYLVEVDLRILTSATNQMQTDFTFTGGAVQVLPNSKGSWICGNGVVTSTLTAAAVQVIQANPDAVNEWPLKGYYVVQSSADGTVNVQISSTVAQTLTVRQGSTITVTQIV